MTLQPTPAPRASATLLLLNHSLMASIAATAGLGMLLASATDTTSLPTALEQITYLGAGALFASILLVIAAGQNIRHLAGKSDTPPTGRVEGLIIFAAITALWVGVLFAQPWLLSQGQAWAGPLLNIFGAGLPVAAFVALGVSKLPIQSTRRGWNIFALGLTIGPIVIILAEILALIALFILFILLLAVNPQWAGNVQAWSTSIETMNPMDVQLMLKNIALSPWAPFTVLASLSVIIPLLEEPLKIIGIWLASDKIATPAEGFALGILSGAGFALFESLGATSAGAANWSSITIGRAGTSALHIFNGGLLGWAMVSAWREQKFTRLALAFTATILLHGVWNAASIGMGIGDAARGLPFALPNYLTSPHLFRYTLIALNGLFVALLIAFNLSLRPRPTPIEYNGPSQISFPDPTQPGETIE